MPPSADESPEDRSEPPVRVELRLPPDARLLRVVRLAASGVASIGPLDLAATEEVRIAIDELCSTLIGTGDGAPIDVLIELTDDTFRVEASTDLPGDVALDVDPLVERMLSAVASSHGWQQDGARAIGRFEKHLSPG